VCGDVAGNADYAWIVNFNNGNSNWNNRNNEYRALAVRSASECQGAVTLRELYVAFGEASRQKSSINQMQFEKNWMDGLMDLQARLNAGTWSPSPSTCFIATKPKAREIHAPDFADRVVHHWLIPHLERIYEPMFIHDNYANRVDKGSHAAVARLHGFVRQVHSGQTRGFFLQLDIHNFFNSIHRPTLWAMLKPRLVRAQLSDQLLHITHALLRNSPVSQGVTYRASPEERARVPAHKCLANAAPGCGLPIGNLSSQFFANVYMNPLDQFVKHELKAKRYLRYVDDFVLVHQSRDQLQEWKHRIDGFLRGRLQLALKADSKLAPLAQGIDFLGYVILPTHMRVRRRVIAHAREKLSAWQHAYVRSGHASATPEYYRQAGSIWASYQGHFSHASSYRLQQQFRRRFRWLGRICETRQSFDYRLEGNQLNIRCAG
jgi:retron-type reverse transcriptase